MLSREEVLESIKSMPQQFEAKAVIEKIVSLEKTHTGIEYTDAGNVSANTEKKLNIWLIR